MASPSVDRAFLASGKLAYNCTDLTQAWPHGGTALGIFGSVVLRPPTGHRLVIEEEHNAPGVVQWTGGTLMLAGRMRGWDIDALGTVFPNSTVVSTERRIDWPGTTNPPGTILPTLTNLVFTPIDVTSNYPSVVLYKAVAVPEDDARMNLSAYRYLDLGVVFIATPDANGRHGSMGPAGSITLA